MLVKLIQRKIVSFVRTLHKILTFIDGRDANFQKGDSEKEFEDKGEDSDQF